MSSQKYYEQVYEQSIAKPKTRRKHTPYGHPEKSANLRKQTASEIGRYLSTSFPNIPVYDFVDGKQYKNPEDMLKKCEWNEKGAERKTARLIAQQMASYKKQGQSESDFKTYSALVVMETENAVEILVCPKKRAQTAFWVKQDLSSCPVYDAQSVMIHKDIDSFGSIRFGAMDNPQKLCFYEQIGEIAAEQKAAALAVKVTTDKALHGTAFDPQTSDYPFKKLVKNCWQEKQKLQAA